MNIDPVISIFVIIACGTWVFTFWLRDRLIKQGKPLRPFYKQLYVAWVVTIVSIVFILARLTPDV